MSTRQQRCMQLLSCVVSETGLDSRELRSSAPDGFLAAGTCCRHVLVHVFLGRGWRPTCVVLGRLRTCRLGCSPYQMSQESGCAQQERHTGGHEGWYRNARLSGISKGICRTIAAGGSVDMPSA